MSMSQLLANKSIRTEPVRDGAAGSDSFAYIPAIDGMRALSIILVLGFHELGPVGAQWGALFNGWVGVDVFFVISGFLITSILLREAATHRGAFSLRKFYARRCLRVAPVYYAFIASAIAFSLYRGQCDTRAFIDAAFFLVNFDLAFGWAPGVFDMGLTHLWSMGIEEQFYLIWPGCLRFFRDHALKFVLASIAFVYFWRIYLVEHGAPWLRLTAAFDTKVDSVLFGVFLALLLNRQDLRERLRSFFGNAFVQISLCIAMLVSFHVLGHPRHGGHEAQILFWSLKMPLANLCTVAFLLSLICNSKAPPAAILSLPPMVFIGKLSYSIYLWHGLVHAIFDVAYRDLILSCAWVAELYQYVLVVATATLSYYCIEKPFLKLKSRFS